MSAPPAADCPSENSLAAFAEGTLDPRRCEQLEGHVDVCSHCRRLLLGLLSEDSGEPLAPEEPTAPSPGATSSARIEVHQRIGRYIIERLVGVGGMGTVYAARDPDLHRVVALKLLRAGLARSRPGAKELLRQRLLREARAMARLSHPNVITVYDVGTFGTQLFIAMELIEGGTLREWLAAGSRSWREILATFLQAGAGLAVAHAAGLVHRDFKPDNVLIGRDGRVRVTDFGLARAVESAERGDAPESLQMGPATALDVALTHTGAAVGTPAYMAPEQIRGEVVDARADVFSFCVALHQALYRVLPFAGTTLAALQEEILADRMRPAPRGTDVPAWVRRALRVGMRASPEDRYASMDALLAALSERPRARRRALLVGGALLVVGALATAAGLRRPGHAPLDKVPLAHAPGADAPVLTPSTNPTATSTSSAGPSPEPVASTAPRPAATATATALPRPLPRATSTPPRAEASEHPDPLGEQK